MTVRRLCRLALLTLLAYPGIARAQSCRVTPAAVHAGGTLWLRCASSEPSGAPETATMNGRTVTLFAQDDGTWLGLMPVPATQAAGRFEIQLAGRERSAQPSLTARVLPTHFPSQNVTLSPEIEALHSTPEEMRELIAFKEGVSDVRYWQESFVAPVAGCVTSPFGVKRLHNGKPTGEYHGGVDQRASDGEPIRAFAAGSVKFAHPFQVLGGAVGLDHGQGLETMYLHMSRIAVSEGEHVERGQIIGYAGSTGRSTGPHLHWVVYVNGVQVNAAQWVALTACPAAPSGARRRRKNRKQK